MKAITLWQPYASLMALRFKQIETRGWETKYRGPIAIHAATRWTDDERITASTGAFALALFGPGPHFADEIFPKANALPRGAVVAVGTIKSCRQVNGDQQPPPEYSYEREFGGYNPGRWMWWIADIRMLAQPIPARGMQKIWEWNAPADLEERLLPLEPLRAMEEWQTQRERILRQMIDHEETWLEDIG